MLNLEILIIPLLQDNYGYLLINHATNSTAAIDPSEADPILRILERRNLRLHYILNTHHHHDHVGGNLALKEATGCSIICSHTDLPRIPGADQGLREGDEFLLGPSRAMVMEIPGHTVGHIAFYFPENRAVFCGDTLFSLGCGRMLEGTPQQMWNSLRRLADLPPETKVYCGHEYTEANSRFALSVDPHNHALQDYAHHVADRRRDEMFTIPSTIDIEAKTNPFLRAPLLAKNLGLPDNVLPHEAFAVLRKMKDDYK